MSPSNIFCPGGSESQSGTAVKERYPGKSISDCGKIPDVALKLESNVGPYVIPVWNSHQGEVKAAEYVWNHIQEAKIKLTDLWAKRIEFWLVRKTGDKRALKRIGSVVVAKTQCSGFLEKHAAELIERALTTIAFDEYRGGAAWDGVLVAPGQGENEPGYEVASRLTANANNFTSFVRLVPSRAFETNSGSVNSWLTGVTMPSFGTSLGDAEHSFFDEMLGSVTDLGNMPRLIFVLKRTAKVGLLFEGTRLHAGDLLDAEDLEGGEISVYEDAGATAKPYTEELKSLFANEFPDLESDDFILHQGVNTCLFACPPLGLYTHGFEIETVEPVVRFYVSKLFQRWEDEDLQCTPVQSDFFKRHRGSWLKKKSEFIRFKVISATRT